jgi:hypothetical protein
LPNPVQFNTFFGAKKGDFFSKDVFISLLGSKIVKTGDILATPYTKIGDSVKCVFIQ